jgi:hypothetical protein
MFGKGSLQSIYLVSESQKGVFYRYRVPEFLCCRMNFLLCLGTAQMYNHKRNITDLNQLYIGSTPHIHIVRSSLFLEFAEGAHYSSSIGYFWFLLEGVDSSVF